MISAGKGYAAGQQRRHKTGSDRVLQDRLDKKFSLFFYNINQVL
jgi:hypothetical protein